ncbi:hypothetical protein K402DRAFT_414774 [Aulographum hederae CBS 113979]|uniref:DUF1168-domain-containing protein n=1 Tax=Aulographum hederae CBS 113979 TaxID=1176131 RepID=A0A6G1GPG5_9PEZI|nr:hypothetical protein K402DRAFT_414774 [Aulographum hederae CBS 113979]
MSEPIPESVPTSADPRSRRPTKKRATTPNSATAAQIETLFAHPEREIKLPPSSNALSKSLAPPPDIVANVQGSSAGAGSGEFHVYKASRRREYERVRAMDEEKYKEEADEKFEMERDLKRKRDEEKTEKNRAKREKARARKKGKGVTGDKTSGTEDGAGSAPKKMAPRPTGTAEGENGDAENGGNDHGAGVEEIGIVIHDEDD